jgi:hypothetical protein
MDITKGTVRRRSACTERKPHLAICGDRQRRFPASPATLDQLSPRGFVPPAATLLAPRVDVPRRTREEAAAIVLAVAYGYTPEEIANGTTARSRAAFEDDLERGEALAHVDLLLDALLPVAPC